MMSKSTLRQAFVKAVNLQSRAESYEIPDCDLIVHQQSKKAIYYKF